MNIRLPRFDPRIVKELRAQKKLIVAGLLCSAGAAALLSTYPVFVKFVLKAVGDHDATMLAYLSLAVIVIFGIKYFLTRGQTFYLSKAATRLTSDLRIRLFDKLMRLPVSYFNDKRAGQIQSVLTNDVNVYQNAIAAVRDSIDGPIKALGGIVTIFVINWQLALASMAVLPFMIFAIQRNSRKMKDAQADVQQDLANLTAMMQESLQGTRIVKAFSAEETMSSRFKRLVETSFESQVRAIRRVASLRPMVEMIGAVALAIVVYLCGRLVASDALKVDDLGAFIIALDVINQGFKNVASMFNTVAQVQAATDRIYEEVLDQPEHIADQPGARTLEHPTGRVEFRNVSFTYPDGTEALHRVSFTVEPGTSLALVGPSGAGKSTIADLMLRFYDPTEGEILFDGIDIRQLQASWLRQQIGVVPQQTFLFAGSISENILLADPDASELDVAEAAKHAHALGFIDQMPNRLQTELGERGIRLSGGEGQRIAIARAIVRKPTMLLLDEATSNLDAVSEKAVQEALEEIMKSRTTLFIAHRLTTAARADRILMLRRGEVVELGSHADLMEMDGAYAGMYRAFTSGVLDGAIG